MRFKKRVSVSVFAFFLTGCLAWSARLPFAHATSPSSHDFTNRFMTLYQSQYFTPGAENTNGPFYWSDKLPGDIVSLIADIPAATGSYSMRRLATDVLAGLPVVIKNRPDEDLLIAAIHKLSHLGAHDSAVSLYQRNADLPDSEPLARAGIEAMLLANKTDAACVDIQLLKEKFADIYWKKVDVLCHFAAGQTVNATLKADLLAEEMADEGAAAPLFTVLAESLAKGQIPPLETLKTAKFTPMTVALLVTGGDALPETLGPASFSGLPVEYYVTLATAPTLPGSTRKAFALKAVDLGLLAPDKLPKILDANTPVLALLNKAEKENETSKKADFIKQGIEKAGGLHTPLSRVFANSFSEMNPDSSHISLAIPATILLYGIGAHNQADKWFGYVREQSSAALTAGQDYLWPVVLMSGGKSDYMTELTQQVEEMLTDKHALETDATARMMAVLKGFDALPGKARKKTDFKISSVDGKVLRRLEKTAKKHQRGETALLGLIALGKQGPLQAEPGVVARVIEDYRIAGLEHEARALGLEALAAAFDKQPNEKKEKYYGSSRSSTH